MCHGNHQKVHIRAVDIIWIEDLKRRTADLRDQSSHVHRAAYGRAPRPGSIRQAEERGAEVLEISSARGGAPEFGRRGGAEKTTAAALNLERSVRALMISIHKKRRKDEVEIHRQRILWREA
jgi:hypothetical protein